MTGLLHQLHTSARLNLTGGEFAFLLLGRAGLGGAQKVPPAAGGVRGLSHPLHHPAAPGRCPLARCGAVLGAGALLFNTLGAAGRLLAALL